MKTFVGIDPGSSGCIVYFDNKGKPVKFLMPKIGNVLDLHTLNTYFEKLSLLAKEGSVHVVTEDLHAIFGAAASATFSFGWINGVIEGMLVAHSIPYTKIQPKKWQAEMFEGIQEIRKPAKTNKKGLLMKGRLDTKAMSILAAKRLYPDFSLTISDRGKKDMDGISDALCMAEFCRRKFK